MTNDFLPYGRHSLDEDDIEAVVRVLREGALTCGPEVERLEQAFANKVGAKHAVVVSNGTTALHLALLATGFGKGDVAIVPSVTFLSTANVALMCGGEVQFADVCPDTGLLTLKALEEAYERADGRAKTVLPVHLTGQSCEMDGIEAFARKHDMAIISDCCHALGAEYVDGGRPGDGRYEDLACYSLHPVKSIAMGEGGVITTNNDEMASHMRLLRSHDMHRDPKSFIIEEAGFDSQGQANPWYYEMHELAYNYRATDFQCALANSQLKKLDGFVEKRRELADVYDQLLVELGNMVQPNPRISSCLSAWHLYAVKIDFKALGLERGQVMRDLMAHGVGTQVHYIPVHRQPFYEKRYGQQNLPGADEYYEQTLSLPLFPAMDTDAPVRVVSILKETLKAK